VRLPAINRDWTFRLNNVGGHFVFRFASIPRGWMIDSIKLKDADITDVPWNVPTDGAEISGLQIVLTQKIGTITGELTDGNGKPITDGSIVIFSEDDKHWFPGSRFLRTTRPTAAGTFSITNLPAGNYFAVAREVLSEGEWESREFLAAASKDAERVELASGTSSQVKLRLLK
jgi:hypothetical protein